jgi:hypothetical protein
MTEEEYLAEREARHATAVEATAVARARHQEHREMLANTPHVPRTPAVPARAMRRFPPRVLPEGHPLLDGPPPIPQRPIPPISPVEHRLARKAATDRNKAARVAALKAQLKALEG